MENDNIHESDTGVMAFDVTPHEPPAPAEPIAPAEPVAPVENPYNSIIEEQKAQIAALMDANKSLTEQVTNLISSGAQISHTESPKSEKNAKPTVSAGEYAPVYGGGENPLSELNTPSLADDSDYSLEALAGEIGKR